MSQRVLILILDYYSGDTVGYEPIPGAAGSVMSEYLF